MDKFVRRGESKIKLVIMCTLSQFQSCVHWKWMKNIDGSTYKYVEEGENIEKKT